MSRTNLPLVAKRAFGGIALNFTSRLLPDSARIRYYTWLSKLAYKVRPQSAKIVGASLIPLPATFTRMGVSATPVRVACTDGNWTVQDTSRVPRLLSGLAGMKQSMFDAYRLSEVGIPRRGVVLDVGANIGEFSALFAGREVRVIAFEPDPFVRSILSANLCTPNIEIREEALSNEDGPAELTMASVTADSSLLSGELGQPTVPVITVRLDRLLENEGIERVELLKMDAEGFEPEVLEGLGERIRDVARLVIDVGPERHGQSSSDAVTKILLGAGFEVSHPSRGQRQVLLAANKSMKLDS